MSPVCCGQAGRQARHHKWLDVPTHPLQQRSRLVHPAARRFATAAGQACAAIYSRQQGEAWAVAAGDEVCITYVAGGCRTAAAPRQERRGRCPVGARRQRAAQRAGRASSACPGPGPARRRVYRARSAAGVSELWLCARRVPAMRRPPGPGAQGPPLVSRKEDGLALCVRPAVLLGFGFKHCCYKATRGGATREGQGTGAAE